jgi:hypothetical protein
MLDNSKTYLDSYTNSINFIRILMEMGMMPLGNQKSVQKFDNSVKRRVFCTISPNIRIPLKLDTIFASDIPMVMPKMDNSVNKNEAFCEFMNKKRWRRHCDTVGQSESGAKVGQILKKNKQINIYIKQQIYAFRWRACWCVWTFPRRSQCWTVLTKKNNYIQIPSKLYAWWTWRCGRANQSR